MAKGNMLQGMARGKVGDVVFSRLNGEQIARVRNRNPKNPRTNAQLFQRAIMATVMQCYSAGKIIFDHAFQGYSVGEACQRAFMSLNAKHLRGVIASDLADNTTKAAVIGPGVTYPVPTPLIVSDGKYPENTFNRFGDAVPPRQGETFAQYYERAGLVPGDIHTVVAFVSDTNRDPIFVVNGIEDDDLAKQYAADFRYVRLQVKPFASGTATISGDTLMSAVYDLTDSKGLNDFDYASAKMQDLNGDGKLVNNALTSALVSTGVGCVGVIRSRLDEDLRSRTTLQHVVDEEDNTVYNGIAAKYALQAWKQGTEKIGDSDLILEGGDQ